MPNQTANAPGWLSLFTKVPAKPVIPDTPDLPAFAPEAIEEHAATVDPVVADQLRKALSSVDEEGFDYTEFAQADERLLAASPDMPAHERARMIIAMAGDASAPGIVLSAQKALTAVTAAYDTISETINAELDEEEAQLTDAVVQTQNLIADHEAEIERLRTEITSARKDLVDQEAAVENFSSKAATRAASARKTQAFVVKEIEEHIDALSTF